MPKGFVKLTQKHDGSVITLAPSSIAYYVPGGRPAQAGGHTYVALKVIDEEGKNESRSVTETEAEIDALIEAAQREHAIDFTKPVRSEFAHGMGHALGAFGGGL